MDNRGIIVVVGELESDSEAILKASESGIIFKNVSSQTDIEYTSEIMIPIIFCGLFSSVCEASTQANIPFKASTGMPPDSKDIISPLPVSISKIKTENEKPTKLSEKEKDVLLEETIEDVIHGLFMNEEEKQINDRANDNLDSDGLEDETLLSVSSKEDKTDEKDPEDSEFTSDNDIAFWEKMKLKTRKRKKYKQRAGSTGKRKYMKYPADFSNYSIKLPVEKIISTLNRQEKVLQQPSESQQKEKVNSQQALKDPVSIKTENENNEDDWITDNEVDPEEDVDIDSAFKMEWKKKRHPYNSKEKNFVCEVCGKLYSKHHYLREHIVRDHSEHEQAKRYPYCCQHCKRLYSGERQLQYHLQQHSGPCEICGVMLKCSGLFWIHRRNHDAQCEICSKVFQTRNSFDMHMKLKHSEKTIPCPLCPRMFPFKFLMNRHVAKTHNSGTPPQHKCEECDFCAKTEGALRIHQRRIHNTVPKMYTCEECNMAFSTKLSFDKHVTFHVGETSFTCQICMRTYRSQNDFHSHMRAIHGGSINGTMRVEQPEPPSHLHHRILMSYPCETCNIMFPTRKNLNRHILKVHGIDVTAPKESKEEPVEEESIQLAEVDETAVAVMQINVTNEDFQPEESKRDFRDEQALLGFTGGVNYQGTRSALLMPANVVPPDVNLVDIDGVQYHVIRGNQ